MSTDATEYETILPSGEVVTRSLAPRADPAPLSLIHAALEKGVTDPTYLQKLLDLQERWEDRQAQGEYNRCLNAAQAEMPAIYKDGENRFNKTRYATLEGVLRAVQPVYLRHGFTLSFGQEPMDNRDGMLRVYVDVSHVAGHTRRYYGDFPIDSGGMKGGDNKTAIQAVGSAFSYARRYLMGLVFNLVFTNEDNDGQPVGGQQPAAARQAKADPSADCITPAQASPLLALIRSLELSGDPGCRAKFLGYWSRRLGRELSDVSYLPAEHYEEAHRALNRRLQEKARQTARQPGEEG